MPHDPRQASIARWVSMDNIRFFLLKSHSVSRIRTRGSCTDATRSRVASSDFPTLTTTSSQTSRIDRIAGTIGKSSWTALRTRVKPDSTSGPELQVVESAVQTVRRQQVTVASALHDATLRQHDDEIGVLHGREPVGDHEDGAVRHQPLDRLLHQPLGLRVERAGGLVEYQDRRIAQQGARDRDALPLPAAEPGPALAQQRGVTLGQPHDELIGVRGTRRRTHLIERYVL